MVTQPPRKQWVIVLKGEIEFEASHVEVQRLAPGVGPDRNVVILGNANGLAVVLK